MPYVRNTKVDALGRTFTYDAENKQTEVKNSSSVSLGQYSYDGDGKRVKKYFPTSGEQTIFVYDASGRMVAEYATTVLPASTVQVSYLTTDHLGSPRINTDADGTVTARHDYQPFGEEIAQGRNTGLGYQSDAVRKQFTSYERDTETDLDFAQARYYSSKLGRFYSVNPENAGADENNPQTWNGYAYVGNNPLNITDPSGMTWIDDGGRPRWIPDDEFNKMSNKNMYKLWTETEYNSTDGRVKLDSRGPNADNPASFTIIGPNIEPPQMSGVAVLGTVAVAGAAEFEPGPGTLLGAAIITGLIANLTTSHEIRQLPVIPALPTTMMNENKGEGSKTTDPLTPAAKGKLV